jgi:hypothetical protein
MTTQTVLSEGPRCADQAAISGKRLWAGYVTGGLATLFMLMDASMKLVKPVYVLDANGRLGYPVTTLSGIGILLIACTVIYVIPRSSIVGAILLTGYLGGAVASQVRAGSGWSETVFPILFGALVWGSLWLRDHRVRSILL